MHHCFTVETYSVSCDENFCEYYEDNGVIFFKNDVITNNKGQQVKKIKLQPCFAYNKIFNASMMKILSGVKPKRARVIKTEIPEVVEEVSSVDSEDEDDASDDSEILEDED